MTRLELIRMGLMAAAAALLLGWLDAWFWALWFADEARQFRRGGAWSAAAVMLLAGAFLLAGAIAAFQGLPPHAAALLRTGPRLGLPG